MEAPSGFNDLNTQLREALAAGETLASEPAPVSEAAVPAAVPAPSAVPREAPGASSVATDPAPVADRNYDKLIEARRAARAEQEALKAERTARQLQDAERAELEEYREMRRLAKEDPVYVAEKLGYKPDEFSTTLLDKGAMTPDRRRILAQEAQASEIKKELEALRRERLEEKAEAAYSARIRDIQGAIAQAPNDAYDLVNRFQAWPQVVQAQIAHWNHTASMGAPEELPLEHALEQVEQHLFESYVKRVAESPKLRGMTAGASAPAARVPPQAAPTARQSGPSQARPTSAAPSAQLTEEQALQKAGELLFRGQRF